MHNTAQQPPVVFIGHGSPMYALGGNPFFDSWVQIGQALRTQYPYIDTVICCSAHWETHQHWQVMADAAPQTIHDFHGFPAALYAQKYPAPGNPGLAGELARQLSLSLEATIETSVNEWGFDHGTWSVLQALYPLREAAGQTADTPSTTTVSVVPLSLRKGLPDHTSIAAHYALGQALGQFIQDKPNILLLGSGNAVHNFGLMRVPPTHAMWQMARDFDQKLKHAMNTGNVETLWEAMGEKLLYNSHPTLEHLLPLVVCAGAADQRFTHIAHHTEGAYPQLGIPIGMRSAVWSMH